MKEFLYIIRGNEDSDSQHTQLQNDSAAWAEHMGKWKSWVEALAQKEQYSGGQPLATGGKVLAGKAKKLTDGPYVEGKEIVGGYLLIKANDINEAAEIAKGCPSFDIGGSLEIREINQLGM